MKKLSFVAVVGMLGAATTAQALEPCDKNHYILDAPCALQWAPASIGLADLDVRVITIDPTRRETIYAGGPSGMFKSTDGGASWSATGLVLPPVPRTYTRNLDPFKYSAVAHIAIDPRDSRTIFAATHPLYGCVHWQRRVLKSVDAGATWTDAVSPNINGCDRIRTLTLAPSDPDTLYVASFDGIGDSWAPVVKSTDGAASWLYPVAYQVLNVLAVDPIDSRTVYGGTFSFDPYFTALPNGVLKSRDGGATWVTTGLTGTGIVSLVVDPRDSRTLYAVPGESWPHFSSVPFRSGYDEVRLLKSSDGGETWAPASEGLADGWAPITNLLVDPEDSRVVYAAKSTGGVFRSVDAAATWTLLEEGLGPYVEIRSLALAPGNPSVLYAGTPWGVFKITLQRPQ